MTATALHHPSFRSAAPLRGLARWWQGMAAARRLAAERRELMALGQYQLNDLGVGRSELPRMLRAGQD